MKQLVDGFGRVHDYLRISVTDQCNLRCVYCMPEEGMEFEPPEHLLSSEEIYEIVKVAAKMGIKKLRLTGGEPTVRKDLTELVQKLSAVPEIEDIALTTNGVFLAKKARSLKEAGITRVNISLDSMNPHRYAEITRGGDVSKVLQAVEACFEVGLEPVKLNVVLMKGMNDEEIDDFIDLSVRYPLQVRFIEYMPIGHEGDDWREKYVPLQLVLERCEQRGLPPVEHHGVFGNGPSENWQLPGAKGSIGFIHPVSDHFCGSCNRLRLTADGYIKPCLYWDEELYVRPFIGDDAAVARLFLKAMALKPENHEMARALEGEKRTYTPTKRRMSQIGG